jgi:hypothetical protein
VFADVIPLGTTAEDTETDTALAQPAPAIPLAEAFARAGITPRREAS